MRASGPKRASIVDVAALAGVSVGTASKALNGRGQLRDETRARVRAAADQLGFAASTVARSLITGRTFSVGVLTTDSYGRFSIPVMRGAEDALVGGLLAAARTAVETATRRILAPGRYRLMLTGWPPDGYLPLPLSPLVGVVRAGIVDANGIVVDLAPGLVRLGPDPVEAPSLIVAPSVPPLARSATLIEIAAGYGGDGPPLPLALAQAIRLLALSNLEVEGFLA